MAEDPQACDTNARLQEPTKFRLSQCTYLQNIEGHIIDNMIEVITGTMLHGRSPRYSSRAYRENEECRGN
jgi:hypothetical protein